MRGFDKRFGERSSVPQARSRPRRGTQEQVEIVGGVSSDDCMIHAAINPARSAARRWTPRRSRPSAARGRSAAAGRAIGSPLARCPRTATDRRRSAPRAACSGTRRSPATDRSRGRLRGPSRCCVRGRQRRRSSTTTRDRARCRGGCGVRSDRRTESTSPRTRR